MHAIRQYEFGSAETLRYEEVDDLEPGPEQVRIDVRAAGMHLLDTMIREGAVGGPFPDPTLPMTPGREVSGVIDAVGPEVNENLLGKRVVAHLGQASGGYAEQALASVAALHELPDDVGFPAAVAMIGTGRTTMAVLTKARIEPEDVVIVPAAAGGIGALLVQEALNIGAWVVGLAGGQEKVAAVRDLGAHLAVDYREAAWPEHVRAGLDGREPTVVLDGVGGDVGRAALELLGVGGRVLLFGWSSGTATRIETEDLYRGGLTAGYAIGPVMLRIPGGLRRLETAALAALADGSLTPLVDDTFRLAEAGKAQNALVARATFGKIVLRP